MPSLSRWFWLRKRIVLYSVTFLLKHSTAWEYYYSEAPPDMSACYYFGKHLVKGSQVFFRSGLSFGFVNRKPVLPGHVLISPLRVVERFHDLTNDEVADLFLSTQIVSKVIENEFKASSLSIAIQDGPDAGQTVKHVHVHLLPRNPGDFKKNDDIYEKLQGFMMNLSEKIRLDGHNHVNFDGAEELNWRTEEDMEKEAKQLREFFDEVYTSKV